MFTITKLQIFDKIFFEKLNYHRYVCEQHTGTQFK